MLLSHAHGYSGPVHDEVSVGGREVSAGSGRDFVTSSQIHELANSPPLLGNTPAAFQIDPWAFRPPPATEGSARQRALTPDEGARRRSTRGRPSAPGGGRPSTVGGGQRTRSSLAQQHAGVRMHGGGLVEAGKLPRPRQEGPDLRFQVNTRLAGGRTAYSGEYTVRGGSLDGSHRVAESFHGSPIRLAPVADVEDGRRQQTKTAAHDQETVVRLESPEPPELGTLPRMYQVQERIKFYMCEVTKDPTGRSLRKLYAEILGAAGRDVRDKESLQFIEMAKLLAMNELGHMYHGGRHKGEVPLPPYPTTGSVSSLMHRDREKEMLKQREALDAINAAETAGNLEAAEAMRSRMEEEQHQKAATAEREPQPEPEPEQPASKGLSSALSRGNLFKALAEKPAGEEEATSVTTDGSVQQIADVHARAGNFLVVIQQFIELESSVDELLAFAQQADVGNSATPGETTSAEESALKELAGAIRTAVTGLMSSVRAFCDANVSRAKCEVDAAQKGSDCIASMWQLLEALGAKVAAADEAGAELAARAGVHSPNGAALVQSALATLAELGQLWKDSIKVELPQKQKGSWVDGLEALLQAVTQVSEKHEQAMLARAQAELKSERNEVKRLRAQLDDLAYANRLATADKEAVAEETMAREANVREWAGAVVIDSVCAMGGEMIAARKRAWTSEDAAEGHKWSDTKLLAAVEELQQLVALPPPQPESEEGQKEHCTAVGQQNAGDKCISAAPPPVDEWLASLTDTMNTLLHAGTKFMREMVSQYSRMREDVVRYE
eukprot:COSAG02_NODE_308_length_25072_cov_20.906925_5_plen_783_part_00